MTILFDILRFDLQPRTLGHLHLKTRYFQVICLVKLFLHIRRDPMDGQFVIRGGESFEVDPIVYPNG